MRAEKESSAPVDLHGLRRLLFDVHELGIAAGEANLDAAGDRFGQGERRLVDDVEQPQVERGPERLGQAAAGLGSPLVGGERGGRREVLLDRVDVV